jgi:hypothetical protein
MSEHLEISERLAKILRRTVLSVLGLAAILAVITMNLMLLPVRHPEVPVWFWIIFLALLFLAGAVVVTTTAREMAAARSRADSWPTYFRARQHRIGRCRAAGPRVRILLPPAVSLRTSVPLSGRCGRPNC